jgi:broad specificity phosphatase PhoE
MTYDDVQATAEYQKFVADPMTQRTPGGEHLKDLHERAVGAVEQGLRDAPAGTSMAIITHADVVRVILAHYLGMNLANYHRLHVAPASVSALSFADDRDLPRVLAVNWNVTLGEI